MTLHNSDKLLFSSIHRWKALLQSILMTMIEASFDQRPRHFLMCIIQDPTSYTFLIITSLHFIIISEIQLNKSFSSSPRKLMKIMQHKPTQKSHCLSVSASLFLLVPAAIFIHFCKFSEINSSCTAKLPDKTFLMKSKIYFISNKMIMAL